jgi:ABC-type branched-subunit amino acid transport system permease subunit
VKRAILGIACLFLGPIIFIALGAYAYVLLEITHGAGANTEGTATQAQQYYSSIAAPVGLGIAGGGVLLSILLAFPTLPKNDKTSAA